MLQVQGDGRAVVHDGAVVFEHGHLPLARAAVHRELPGARRVVDDGVRQALEIEGRAGLLAEGAERESVQRDGHGGAGAVCTTRGRAVSAAGQLLMERLTVAIDSMAEPGPIGGMVATRLPTH